MSESLVKAKQDRHNCWHSEMRSLPRFLVKIRALLDRFVFGFMDHIWKQALDYVMRVVDDGETQINETVSLSCLGSPQTFGKNVGDTLHYSTDELLKEGSH